MTPQEFRRAAQEWCATISPDAVVWAEISSAHCFDDKPVRLTLALTSQYANPMFLHAHGSWFESALVSLKEQYALHIVDMRQQAVAAARRTLAELESVA